jgi:hypothetical protein
MSRVEPKEKLAAREAEKGRRQPVDRTPVKAESDQKTIDKALKNQAGRMSRVGGRA